jgi:hypothetical protein
MEKNKRRDACMIRLLSDVQPVHISQLQSVSAFELWFEVWRLRKNAKLVLRHSDTVCPIDDEELRESVEESRKRAMIVASVSVFLLLVFPVLVLSRRYKYKYISIVCEHYQEMVGAERQVCLITSPRFINELIDGLLASA